MTGVSADEAVAILRRMIAEPEAVFAVHSIDEDTSGPVPFFFDDAEITFTFDGGVIEDVASVRIDRRFSNSGAWELNPFDALPEYEIEALEAALGAP